MCTNLPFCFLALFPGYCGMASKTYSEKITHLESELEKLEQLKNDYRTQAVTAEIEVLRLNQEIKKQRENLAAIQLQNGRLVDRIVGLLSASEVKQS